MAKDAIGTEGGLPQLLRSGLPQLFTGTKYVGISI